MQEIAEAAEGDGDVNFEGWLDSDEGGVCSGVTGEIAITERDLCLAMQLIFSPARFRMDFRLCIVKSPMPNGTCVVKHGRRAPAA